MRRVAVKASVGGAIDAPPSKSSMQRAVACALLARGESRIKGGELSEDSRAALGAAQALGAKVESEGGIVRVEGSPLFGEKAAGREGKSAEALIELDCGESGLCMRMFAPIAALLGRATKLTGRGTLAARPMGMVEKALATLGGSCSSDSGKAPLFIRGPLKGGLAEIDAGESSQLLTGLLIALPLAADDSELWTARVVSRGYLDLTLDTMRAFGVEGRRNADYSRFYLSGRQRYQPCDFTVEGDWSGAAFLIVAGALAARESGLAIRGLRPDSSQPDRAVLEASRRAGADLRLEDDVVVIRRGRLEAFEFDAADCPDLFPPLAALASACRGVSALRGVRRLAGKESDRAASLKAVFEALGARVNVDGDLMTIEGGSLRGGEVEARGDHRIAMAAATAALAASGEVAIAGSECVAKSWPRFFEDMAGIGVRVLPG